MAERERGYYWAKIKGKDNWIVLAYCGDGAWYSSSDISDINFEEWELAEIGEQVEHG